MIEGFWIRQFRSLKRLGIGSCFELFSVVDGDLDRAPFELGPVTLFTGNSGAGKSTIFDALAFLADCFHCGLDYAGQKRGGVENIFHQEAKSALSIGIDVRLKDDADVATYAVAVGCDKNGVPFIESEILAVKQTEKSFPVIFLQNGATSIRYLAPDESLTSADLTKIEFTDYNHLGLSNLQRHQRYPVLAVIRDLLENWLECGLALDLFDTTLSKRQHSPRGRCLSDLIRFIIHRYGDATPRLLERVARFLPNVEKIFVETPSDGTPKLTFKMHNLERPIPAALISEATLRLFVYAVLLEEDNPAPLIALREPESGFDQPHLEMLRELIRRVIDFPRFLQLFISTRTPELFEGVPASSVWHLERRDGENITARVCD